MEKSVEDEEDVEETTAKDTYTVKVAKNGRVTIPKKIRDELGIKENDRIFAIKEGRSIRFTVGLMAVMPECKNVRTE